MLIFAVELKVVKVRHKCF